MLRVSASDLRLREEGERFRLRVFILILILLQDVHKKFLVNFIEIILFTRSNRIAFEKVKLFCHFVLKRTGVGLQKKHSANWRN